MKKHLLLSFLLFASASLIFGQSLMNPKAYGKQLMPEPMHPSGIMKTEASVPGNTEIPPYFKDEVEQKLGETMFDAQTVGSMNRRIFTDGDNVSAIWHFGNMATDFPDRGTAYNHFDGTNWGDEPTGRVEGATRGGYPSFTVLGNGTEVIVSHSSPMANYWEINTYTKASGATDWTQGAVPASESTGGMVWAKVATGGMDGNSIHLIALTLNETFGGTPYRGLDQHILYYRSQDGGTTWDISDMVIPGCDSTSYRTHDSESYIIEAEGNTVAIGMFSSWGDVAVFKSTDNGDSWNKQIINDFPLDRYDGTGYTPADIPADPNAPDSVSIFSTDGYGSMVIDDAGMVHVTFGEMYVSGNDIGEFFYWPAMDGLAYWNESMGENNFIEAAVVEDMNGDSIISVGTIPMYFLSLTSMPSMGVDADGNIYVAYAAFNELFMDSDGENYRQTYLIESKDGGMTWSAPYATVNAETLSPDLVDFIDFIEAVYPSVPKRIGEKVQLIYQQDFEPGLAVSGDMDEPQPNAIQYVQIDKANIGVTSTKDISLAENLRIFPNPASEDLNVVFDLKTSTDVKVRILDLIGRNVAEFSLGQKAIGTHRENLQIKNLKPGIHFLQIKTEEGMISEKVIFE